MKRLRILVYFLIGGFAGLGILPFLPDSSADWVKDAQSEVADRIESIRSPSGDDASPKPPDALATSDGGKPTVTTNSPTQTADERLDELTQLALMFVNQDRKDHGLRPVRLGESTAAQTHADDMLRGKYQSHWTRSGLKPYMIYSLEGGQGYVAENAASAGWTDLEWALSRCDSFNVRCQTPDPEESIKELHWSMVNDDAHADWGHRDNILRPKHEYVNFGIAWDNRFVAFIQHFESDSLTVVEDPTLARGVLSFEVRLDADQSDIGEIVSIYYDPPPQSRSAEELNRTSPNSYCLGGGYSNRCPNSLARILEPLPEGWHYDSLKPSEVIAREWTKSGSRIRVVAELGSLVSDPGVYTIVLWDGDLDNVIFERSIWVN